MIKKINQPDSAKDEGIIKKKQKKIISDKKENNPNRPENKTFPENLTISDYVTIDQKEFKRKMHKSRDSRQLSH